MKGHEQLNWFVFIFKIVPQCVAQILTALHAQRLFVQRTGYDVWCNVPAVALGIRNAISRQKCQNSIYAQ